MSNEDNIDATHREFLAQLDRVRPVTRNLIDAILFDSWPNHAAIVDFGIDGQVHYEALYYPIREGEILPLALDEALGHGEKLTHLTRNAASNPHKSVEFYTSWDVMYGRKRLAADVSEHFPSPAEIARHQGESPGGPGNATPLPSPGDIAREHDASGGLEDIISGNDRQKLFEEWKTDYAAGRQASAHAFPQPTEQGHSQEPGHRPGRRK